MTTPNFPDFDSHNQPVNTGELKISPETILAPEQMVETARQLLVGFEAEFTQVGEIPVASDPESELFQSGKTAKTLWTPGIGDRTVLNPLDHDGSVKDFLPAFVQCFGKTVTMRLRGEQTLKNSEQRHKEVPKLVRELLNSNDAQNKSELLGVLHSVVAHNMELLVNDPKTIEAMRAYIWMLDKLSAAMAPAEAA